MKKLFNYAFLFLTIGILATSCKKEATPVDLSNTNWIGTILVSSLVYDSTVITLNANGKLTGNIHKVGGTAFYAINGTWSKTPNSNTVYFYHTITTATGTYEASATLNSDNTKLEGGIGVNSISSASNYTYSFSKQ